MELFLKGIAGGFIIAVPLGPVSLKLVVQSVTLIVAPLLGLVFLNIRSRSTVPPKVTMTLVSVPSVELKSAKLTGALTTLVVSWPVS